jgi:hypothetical protein
MKQYNLTTIHIFNPNHLKYILKCFDEDKEYHIENTEIKNIISYNISSQNLIIRLSVGDKNQTYQLKLNGKTAIYLFIDSLLEKYNIDFRVKNKLVNDLSIKLNLKQTKEELLIEDNFNNLNINKFFLINIDLNFDIWIHLYETKYDSFSDKPLNEKRIRYNEEKREKIKYNISENLSKDLLFCLTYDNSYLLTIHDKNSENPIITKQQHIIFQNNLFEEILVKIKNIEEKIKTEITTKELNKEINKQLKDYNIEKIEDIILNNIIELDENSFNEDNFKESINYFYLYEANIIYKSIIIILNEKHINQNLHVSQKKKNIISLILKKFSYFHEYVQSFLTNNIPNNIKLNKKNENITFQEKIKKLSTILTIIYQSPFYDKDSIIQFLTIPENPKNVYSQIKQLFFKIIDESKSYSSIINGIEILFSKISKNHNVKSKNYNEDCFIIEDQTLEQLKMKIKSFYPNYFVTYFNVNDKSIGIYDIMSDSIIFNEAHYLENKYLLNYNKKVDGKKLYENLNLIINGTFEENKSNKKIYNKIILRGLLIILHESYGHQIIQRNNNFKVSTPTKFYFDGNFITDRDAGQILEFFISDNPNNINSIKTIDADVSPLLDYKLYLDNFNEFWNIFDRIFDNLGNDSDFELSDDYSEDEKDYISSVNKIYKLYYSSINFKYDKRKKFKYQKINQNKINNLRFKI